jgi:CheY-like chemotaxis protein
LFLANMSHEIRTPLGAILGFTALLNEGDLSAADRANYTEIVARNGEQLTQLINDILDLSKVEAGHLEMEQIEFSLTNLVSDLTSLMKFRAQEKGLTFTVVSKSVVPDVIISDPTRLRQILFNIIGNAIKFTERGGVNVTIEADDSTPRKISFAVEDTGAGIKPESQNRLFEWFTQADASTTRKFGGTGLGLAISRKFARALGGNVELVSSNESGTKFNISIACSVQPSKMASERNYAAQMEPGIDQFRKIRRGRELSDFRVLIVDDSADNRLLIQNILQRKGIHVESAENGKEGVEKALKNEYDLVLMDIQMPVLDGLQATALLRKRGYLKPIVALTAHAMKEEREKTRAAGCNFHLTKPIEIGSLLNVVSNFAQSDQ